MLPPSAAIFPIVPDLFPRRAPASVAGIGGLGGGWAGNAAIHSPGRVQTDGGARGYFHMFFAAGASGLLAPGTLHLLTPRLLPADLGRLP